MLIGNFYQHAVQPEEAVRAFDAGAAASPKEKFFYEKHAMELLIAAGKRRQALDRIQRLLAENMAGESAYHIRRLEKYAGWAAAHEHRGFRAHPGVTRF